MKPGSRTRRVRMAGTVKCPGCSYAIDVAFATCPVCKASLEGARRIPRKPVHHEDGHMQALWNWRELQKAAMPDLELLAHWPNGGERGAFEAKRMQGQGVVKGPPDWYLDVARGGFFGLRIELKPTREDLGGKKPWVRPEQRAWMAKLREQGFHAVSCEGWEAARDTLLAYIAQPRTRVVA